MAGCKSFGALRYSNHRGAHAWWLQHKPGVAATPQTKETTMYRTLITAAAFVAISFGTVTASHAQGFSLQPLNSAEQTTVQAPADNVQGTPTNEVKEGE